eukprot:CAMPEP_0202863712 /NCGR_PEP_ID=MMETSP1391-20130828/4235_1 /ASSEMBLY_ACC=CAM_ASM_000867 /TAXON_ID=1034604 /ORGANISM="Chlamydomonas leiostraca, Strain SAG 11-49" /LENGTH=354 /DNA_ID=CAMNT_0049543371 /DNA_START=164 /DNA_END=1228 /DNA_ORIENTATION=-
MHSVMHGPTWSSACTQAAWPMPTATQPVEATCSTSTSYAATPSSTIISRIEAPTASRPSPAGMSLFTSRGIHTSRPMRDEDSNGQSDQGHHPYFPRLSQENKFQAQLEAAEVGKAWDGLLVCPWSELVDTPGTVLQRTLFGRPLAAFRRWVLGGLAGRVSDVATTMVQNEVEESFDREEFLAGAEAAVGAVLERWGEGDYDSLKQLCSERLAERMKIAADELREERGVALSGLELTSVNALSLVCINLWTAESIARFDPKWPEEVTPSTSSSWLVATVEIDATVTASLATAPKDKKGDDEEEGDEDDKGESGEGGKSAGTQQLARRGAWLFARGPLPRGASQNLNLPWRVISWW